MSRAFSVWWCLETNRSLSGPPLDFHDKYSNIDRYRGWPGSCQLCLLAGLINCFTISRPAGGPLLDHFCPPSGRRMERAAECSYRQPPCAQRVTPSRGKVNSFRHRTASSWPCHFICMLKAELGKLGWEGALWHVAGSKRRGGKGNRVLVLQVGAWGLSANPRNKEMWSFSAAQEGAGVETAPATPSLVLNAKRRNDLKSIFSLPVWWECLKFQSAFGRSRVGSCASSSPCLCFCPHEKFSLSFVIHSVLAPVLPLSTGSGCWLWSHLRM